MSTDGKIVYRYAILRAVPHVHTGAFTNVGVVLHVRTLDYLGVRVITDVAELQRRVPDADAELLARYLRSCELVCAGDASAGPIALDPPSERFHWITSPRSDVLQSSPVHEGVGTDPERTLEQLFRSSVGGAP